jgi:hypothetical protein
MLAALNERMLETAGALADSVVLNYVPVRRIGSVLEVVRRGAERAGRREPEVVLSVACDVSDDTAAARRRWAREFAFYLTAPPYRKALTWHGYTTEVSTAERAWSTGGLSALRDSVADRFIDELAIIGPPDRCRDRLLELQAAGVSAGLAVPAGADPLRRQTGGGCDGCLVRIDRRTVLGVGVGLVGIAGARACASRVGSPAIKFWPRNRGGCVNQTSAMTSPQCVSAGYRMPWRRPPFRLSPPGTVVGRSAVFGDRVFLNADEGVAFANGDNAQYPVLSTDGGRVWRIDGPALHVDAADGAEGVGSTGIAARRTFFAYGSSVVDVTTDRGRTWWETYLGEDVAAVLPSYRSELVAYVEQSLSNQHLNPAVTWQYVSRDRGRHWRYSTDFAGIPG